MMGKDQITESPLQRLCAALWADQAKMTGPLPDAAMDRLIEVQYARVVQLSQLVAGDLEEAAAKLDVLCQRLREYADPEDSGRVLLILLAESVRDDLRVLEARGQTAP